MSGPDDRRARDRARVADWLAKGGESDGVGPRALSAATAFADLLRVIRGLTDDSASEVAAAFVTDLLIGPPPADPEAVKCPCCPVCGTAGLGASWFAQAFCLDTECDVFLYDPYSTAKANLDHIGELETTEQGAPG